MHALAGSIQATGHHFSVACISCNRTRMKVTHHSIPTSSKPRMWVLALTKIHLQAGSAWFRNQVAQMSCIVVQQTQHNWNQHHHLCVLVWVARCKSVPVPQDWLICLQNNENFSPFRVSELLQLSFVCQLSGIHQVIAKRCFCILFSHLKARYR